MKFELATGLYNIITETNNSAISERSNNFYEEMRKYEDGLIGIWRDDIWSIAQYNPDKHISINKQGNVDLTEQEILEAFEENKKEDMNIVGINGHQKDICFYFPVNSSIARIIKWRRYLSCTEYTDKTDKFFSIRDEIKNNNRILTIDDMKTIKNFLSITYKPAYLQNNIAFDPTIYALLEDSINYTHNFASKEINAAFRKNNSKNVIIGLLDCDVELGDLAETEEITLHPKIRNINAYFIKKKFEENKGRNSIGFNSFGDICFYIIKDNQVIIMNEWKGTNSCKAIERINNGDEILQRLEKCKIRIDKERFYEIKELWKNVHI